MGNWHDGSGITDNHAIWAGGVTMIGFVFARNELTVREGGRVKVRWAQFASDVLSAVMIYVIALGVMAWGVNSLNELNASLREIRITNQYFSEQLANLRESDRETESRLRQVERK